MDAMWPLLLVGGIALVIGIAIYDKTRVTEAAESKSIRFASSDRARECVDRIAVKARLDRTGWEQHGDVWKQAVYPGRTGRDPFRIDVVVRDSGVAELQLVAEGTSQSVYAGFIPTGPKTPFGTEQFLAFNKLLGKMGVASPGSSLSTANQSRPAQGRTAGTRSNATPSEVIMAAIGKQRRCSFEWLDRQISLDLLVTLDALQHLIDGRDLVREPGGFYRTTGRRQWNS